jgi:hypothetical protein
MASEAKFGKDALTAKLPFYKPVATAYLAYFPENSPKTKNP